MKLSIFTTVTDPIRRGDCWLPAIQCYSELADEVVVVDGSQYETFHNMPANVRMVEYPWPDEFDWAFIGQQFTRGYEACTGDWVLYADIDMLFHETDFGLIRRVFEENPNTPALTFWKYQFILPDRYNLKSRLVLAVNKKLLGDRVKFDSGGDLCRPSIDGVEIDPSTCKESRIPVYNYEKINKNYNQVTNDVGRMARAWQRQFGEYKLGGEDDESAFDEWAKMLKGRFNKPQQRVGLFRHPQFIIPTITQLKKDQFGYDGFGILELNDYVGGRDA